MTAPFRISRPTPRPGATALTGDDGFRFYLDRLFKMIPGEVISLYLVGSGLIPQDQTIVLVLWSVICLGGVVIVRIYGTADPPNDKPPQWGPITISAISFVIWVYSLGGPFAAFGLAVPWVGSLLILLWTFFVPIFYRGPFEL